MKKTYMIPTLKVENAMPASLICESQLNISGDSNTGLTPGGGSNGDAHTQEWNIWGDE